MSIEKYLDDVKVPQGHPGPYSVKLKYDIKKRLLAKRRNNERIFVVLRYLNVMLFVFVALILYKPDYAVMINQTLTAKNGVDNLEGNQAMEVAETAPQQDDLPFLGEGVALGTGHIQSSGSLSRAVPVSTGPHASSTFQILELSQLQVDRPYVIRKIKGTDNHFIYFVNEIAVEQPASQRRSRIPY